MPAIRARRYIAQFNTEICYLPGEENDVADALSRVNTFTSPTHFDWSDPQLLTDPEVRKVLANINAFRLPTIFDPTQLSQEQANDEQLKEILNTPDHPLKLRRLTWGPDHTPFYCDFHEDSIRPYMSEKLRRTVFDSFHSLSHPGAKVTNRFIHQQYVWPTMSRDISSWCKLCVACQQSKVARHNKFLPKHFVAPDARFDHVHLDLVGPFAYSQGYTHVLTIIDRYTRWPEAIPIADTTAATVARAFYNNWICRYGAPTTITTDQGAQFESRIFTELLSILGVNRIRTTSYHPASNGMVERLHRDIKTALMCHGDNQEWVRLLPTVMLGLRTRIRLDTDTSLADLVFGNPMRIPGDFSPFTNEEPNVRSFYNEFRDFMRQLRPVPVSHKTTTKPFLHQGLDLCTHVWLREKPIRPALTRPYTGPHKVISRNKENHTFNIDLNGTSRTVSMERVKPAFILQKDPDVAKDKAPEPIRPPTPITVHDRPLPADFPEPPQSLAADEPSSPFIQPSPPKPKRVKFVPNILKRNRKN